MEQKISVVKYLDVIYMLVRPRLHLVGGIKYFEPDFLFFDVFQMSSWKSNHRGK